MISKLEMKKEFNRLFFAAMNINDICEEVFKERDNIALAKVHNIHERLLLIIDDLDELIHCYDWKNK